MSNIGMLQKIAIFPDFRVLSYMRIASTIQSTLLNLFKLTVRGTISHLFLWKMTSFQDFQYFIIGIFIHITNSANWVLLEKCQNYHYHYQSI